MAKNKNHPVSHGNLIEQTRNKLMLPDGESISPVGATELTGTQKATKKALTKMESFDEIFGTTLSDAAETKKKFYLLDIETGIDDDAKEYMPNFSLQKPEIKEPKYKKDGELYAGHKTIFEQEAEWIQKEEELEKEWLKQCPLNPTTAKIICVSVTDPNGTVVISTIQQESEGVFTTNEADLIKLAWHTYEECRRTNSILVGHNIKKFDLPMLVRRSWKHNIKPSHDGMLAPWESKWIVDTMVLWNQGNYGEKYISLDNLGQFLGFGKKIGKGADFERMLETNPQAAMQYVTSEMKLLRNIANRLL